MNNQIQNCLCKVILSGPNYLRCDRKFLRREHPNKDDKNSVIDVFSKRSHLGCFKATGSRNYFARYLAGLRFKRYGRFISWVTCFEGVGKTVGVRGLLFIVQRTVANQDVLLEPIEHFLVEVRKGVLEAMTEDRFEDYVTALVVNKAEPDRAQMKWVERFWSDITTGFLQFVGK